MAWPVSSVGDPMIRTIGVFVVAHLLTACGRSEPAVRQASVFGAMTPIRIMQWWHECDVPLVLTRPRGAQTYWRLECREDLGGEPDLKLAPPPIGWGAAQQGWVVGTDEHLRIYMMAVIARPERFEARATAIIRALMPPTIQGAAVDSLSVPPEPPTSVVSLSMDIPHEAHQHRPLMQRYVGGKVFATTSATWSVSPIFFVP